MKNILLFFSIVIISLSVKAQEQKVEIVHDSLFNTLNNSRSRAIIKYNCGFQAVDVEYVSSDYFLPFKFYHFSSKKENWFNIQSVFNTIQTKVLNVLLTNTDLNSSPDIQMRGDKNTIVIIDGVRYDVSVLNTLNAADIESILVAPGAAASNYLRNN